MSEGNVEAALEAIATMPVRWPTDETGAMQEVARAALRSRGSTDTRLTEAVEGLDEPWTWIAEHYPKAMREMPRDLYGRLAVAHAALADARADAPQEQTP